jgi:hypothetical protein
MQSTWRRAIPCWSKVAVARGKCGLGMVANMDWHEISECEIKNATIRPGSKNSKIATCSLLPDLLVDDHQKLKISLSTFSGGRYTTVRLRSCISPFPPFSESSIKTVLNQSAKKTDLSVSLTETSSFFSDFVLKGRRKAETFYF